MSSNQAHPLHIYTDGSSRGNPGPGGYGIVMIWGKHQKEISAGYRLTTNNRMELMAVIVALQSIHKKNIPITIFTDSLYVVKAVNEKWLDKWIKTDFKGGKKNKDLWMKYAQLAKQFQITLNWVKGHADNALNNRCDELATAAANSNNLLVDEYFESEYTK